jgi:PAS domain S-box-containing protein
MSGLDEVRGKAETPAVGFALTLDADGCILDADRHNRSDRLAAPKFCPGSIFIDYLHPEDRAFCAATLRWAADAPGRQGILVLRLQHEGRLTESVRARLVGQSSGTVRVAMTFDSIMLRRTAQEHLRTVLENAPQGVLVRNAAGRILYANPALPRLMGYTREEFLDIGNITHFIHPEDRALVTARAHARVANQDVPAQYEFRFVHRDGSVVWVDCLASHAIWGDQPVSLAWMTDLSGRKRTEEALRRSERLFVKVFQESPDVITLSTVDDGRYVDVNEAYLKLTKRQRSEVIGHTSLEFGVWSDPNLRTRLIERLRRDGAVRETAAFVLGEDGTTRDYSISAEIFQFDDEDLLLITSHDITEQRRQEELRWRSQKLEALGTLAGGIAHDLNNTLVPVLSLTKLTARRLPEGSRERQNLMTVLTASERARDLVKQILAFSRQERLERDPVDLAVLLREAMDMLRASLPATIHIDLVTTPVPPILANAGQLHQVIINLVTNAAQAIGEAMGTIAIKLTPAAGPDAPCSGEAPCTPPDQADWVCVSVADSGAGMDEATLRRAFEPFFTTKSVGEGTGLGLAVVHGIVTSHGGTIEASSTPGKGTQFTICFPAMKDEAAVVLLPETVPAL